MHIDLIATPLQGSVYKQLQLHADLYTVMYGVLQKYVAGVAPSSVPVNPQRLLELWDYEGSLSAQVGLHWQLVQLCAISAVHFTQMFRWCGVQCKTTPQCKTFGSCPSPWCQFCTANLE